MQFKIPKSDKYQWTRHAQWKMRQYGLSPQRVIRVIRNPERIEEGIVEKTIAVMQPASVRHGRTSAGKPAKTWSQEIWAMYQLRKSGAISKSQFLPPSRDPAKAVTISNKISNPKFQKLQTINQKLKIISAWRYPGVSPKNNPIPEEILREIAEIK
ncbi:MAG: DUF4258 domain-containing protein [Parcubacteria group bacterium]